MKVILIKDIVNLGEIGEEVIVKDGYARNYLLPKNYAIKATKGAVAIVEQKKREKQLLEEKRVGEYKQLAEKIEAASCTISMDAGEEDKLFGAVTAGMIAECLNSEGIEVDKKKIILEEPIKALGVYNVEIHLHAEVKAQARIWVVKK